MKWTLAALLSVLVLDVNASSVDACGIKLVIKTSTPRKAVARSSNPSQLLLVGTPPHRLEHELSAAGHSVEVEPNVSDAKRSQYAVVVVDAKQADEARTKFAGAIIVVRSGDVASDVVAIESQVTRRPLRTDESRPVLARSPARRQPVAATTPKIVAAKEPESSPPIEPAVAVQPKPSVAEQPKPVAEQPKPEPKRIVEQPKPVVAEQPKPATAPKPFHGEVYFNVGSADVARKAALAGAVRWLTNNQSVQAVVEGYADPTGTPEANMALGQSRAESVRDYLVSAGIDQSRLEVVSYGDTRLKYGRSDSRNRRVAIEPKP
jgi:peptidoglycan-associated lipoprotein